MDSEDSWTLQESSITSSTSSSSGCGSGSGSGSDKRWRNGPQWKEVSRPQVHGFDLNAVVAVPPASPASGPPASGPPASSSPYLLFTAGDEKVIRAFDAPLCVIEGLNILCGIDVASEKEESATASKITAR